VQLQGLVLVAPPARPAVDMGKEARRQLLTSYEVIGADRDVVESVGPLREHVVATMQNAR
jgi:hypothetical protein